MQKSIRYISVIAAVLAVCLVFAACAVGVNTHELKDNEGIVLYTDDAINTSDTASQAKIESYMKDKGVDALEKSLTTDQMEAKLFAKGNVMVFRIALKNDMTDEQASALETSTFGSVKSIDIKEGRSETGADAMVVVYAFLNKDGKVLKSEIVK